MANHFKDYSAAVSLTFFFAAASPGSVQIAAFVYREGGEQHGPSAVVAAGKIVQNSELAVGCGHGRRA